MLSSLGSWLPESRDHCRASNWVWWGRVLHVSGVEWLHGINVITSDLSTVILLVTKRNLSPK